MELALHIRSIPPKGQMININGHLGSFYDGSGYDVKTLRAQFPSIDRIYVGDEFCPIRLPGLKELERFCRFAKEKKVGLTLLTPVLTDAGLNQYAELFGCLENGCPDAEVVVNDIGVLLFLRERHPGFRFSMGRLFNKGFKDPRLPVDDIMHPQPEIVGLLNESTYDHPNFQKVRTRLNVKRLERDLMPYGKQFKDSSSDYKTSYYFPFGYVTTGRVCWTATFNGDQKNAFTPPARCSKPCNTLSLQLKNHQSAFELIQAGNTVFYLYSPEAMGAFIKKAERENCRLVYQGLMV
jgi:hypothetical protein